MRPARTRPTPGTNAKREISPWSTIEKRPVRASRSTREIFLVPEARRFHARGSHQRQASQEPELHEADASFCAPHARHGIT